MGANCVSINGILNTIYTSGLLNRGLLAISGWTDGANCDGSGTYVVDFSKQVKFLDHTGAGFIRNPVPPVLGTELNSDVNFNNNCGVVWDCFPIFSSIATVGGGEAQLSADSTYGTSIQLVNSIPNGALIEVEMFVSSKVAPSTIEIYPANSTNLVSFSGAGLFKAQVVKDGTADFSIYNVTTTDNDNITTIDYISIKEVLTPGSGERLPATSSTISPAKQIVYNAPIWTSSTLQPDDVVVFDYIGSVGNYKYSEEPAQFGSTGTNNCTVINDTTIQVVYKDDVSWTDHANINFFNVNTGETSSQPTTTVEPYPSKIVTYTNVIWVTQPIADDVIQVVISEPNNYRDRSFMDAQTLRITNCLDGTNSLVELYGDSYSTPPTGYIGLTLFVNSSKAPYSFLTHGVSGANTTDIRNVFNTNYPGSTATTVLIQGSINNIAGTEVKITDLQTMFNDVSYMVDTVLGDGKFAVVIGLAPIKGLATWTQEMDQKIRDYNAWAQARYPSIYVDIYNLLGDPNDSQQMADEYYKDSRGDLHPNINADSVIDTQIGNVLYARTPISTVYDPANYMASNRYRDLSSWTATLMFIGGNNVILVDGTLGNTQGIVTPPGLTVGAIATNTATAPPVNQPMTMIVKLRAGLADWAWVEISDSDKKTYQVFVDLVNMVTGVESGTATGPITWVVTRAEYGWIELKGSFTNSAVINGTGVVSTRIRPQDDDAIHQVDGDGRSPVMYADLLEYVNQ